MAHSFLIGDETPLPALELNQSAGVIRVAEGFSMPPPSSIRTFTSPSEDKPGGRYVAEVYQNRRVTVPLVITGNPNTLANTQARIQDVLNKAKDHSLHKLTPPVRLRMLLNDASVPTWFDIQDGVLSSMTPLDPVALDVNERHEGVLELICSPFVFGDERTYRVGNTSRHAILSGSSLDIEPQSLEADAPSPARITIETNRPVRSIGVGVRYGDGRNTGDDDITEFSGLNVTNVLDSTLNRPVPQQSTRIPVIAGSAFAHGTQNLLAKTLSLNIDPNSSSDSKMIVAMVTKIGGAGNSTQFPDVSYPYPSVFPADAINAPRILAAGARAEITMTEYSTTDAVNGTKIFYAEAPTGEASVTVNAGFSGAFASGYYGALMLYVVDNIDTTSPIAAVDNDIYDRSAAQSLTTYEESFFGTDDNISLGQVLLSASFAFHDTVGGDDAFTYENVPDYTEIQDSTLPSHRTVVANFNPSAQGTVRVETMQGYGLAKNVGIQTGLIQTVSDYSSGDPAVGRQYAAFTTMLALRPFTVTGTPDNPLTMDSEVVVRPGGSFRVLASLKATGGANADVRARLGWRIGTFAQALTRVEVYRPIVKDEWRVYDLGVVPVPPVSLGAGLQTGDLKLVVSWYDADARTNSGLRVGGLILFPADSGVYLENRDFTQQTYLTDGFDTQSMFLLDTNGNVVGTANPNGTAPFLQSNGSKLVVYADDGTNDDATVYLTITYRPAFFHMARPPGALTGRAFDSGFDEGFG